MKFIHTADLHLGKSFPIVGDKGSLLREAQLNTLARIMELAESNAVDFILFAGDLFDSNEVSKRIVQKTIRLLNNIEPIPVFILPGTHDLLNEESIYKRNEFRGGNIKIFGIDGTSIKIKNTIIHGRPNDTKQGGIHPLKELNHDPDAKFNVAAIHASVKIESKASPDDYLVTASEIANSGMDYVAIGHWHKKMDFSEKKVDAWYSGAPEATKFDEAEKAGFVLLVELGKAGVKVEEKKVGEYTWIDKSINVSISPPGKSLNSEIEALKGEKTLLRLRLKGTIPKGYEIDADLLEENFADDFFYFEVDSSKVGYPIKDVDQVFAKGTIGGLYVSRLKELIRKAKDKEEKAMFEEALYLGSGYILGDLEVD